MTQDRQETKRLPEATLLLRDASVVLTCEPKGGDLLGRIENGCIAIAGDRIVAVGPAERVTAQADLASARVIDVRGKIIAPGFVDSHTHLIFGGSRVHEYAARMTRTPEEVRALGFPTGIQATVEMTRRASMQQLKASAKKRLWGMLAHGTTTVESKSGYGLSLDHEMTMLQINRSLGSETPVDVISTFLGAHAVPPEVNHERYVEMVIQEMIPAVSAAGLATFCDVYCDEGYFTVEDCRRILLAARAAGLELKIHTDQYSHLGGSELAAELGVVSADHLNYTPRAVMRKLAGKDVVGVLMPAIDFAVRHPRPFNARAMLEEGMTLALATDLCPGGWTESLQLVMQFACRLNRFTPDEALYAATVGGARALGLDDRGSLSPGMLADLQIWNLPEFEDIIYRLGNNAVETVIKRGEVVIEHGNG